MDAFQVESIIRPMTSVRGTASKTRQLEQLFGSLSSAASVESHSSFFRWLQNEISDYLPHEALFAVWGNFQTGELDYDVTSAVPGLDTQSAYSITGLKPLLVNFYKQACSKKQGWFIQEAYPAVAALQDTADLKLLELTKEKMKSMLVYSMHDERGDDDCLYIFFSKNKKIQIDSVTLGFLMPHIDAALRRVKCFKDVVGSSTESRDLQNGVLSGRELQVMKWVTEGKSNAEIGTILGISHNTVKNHLKRVFAKMEVTARSQAVRIYLLNNFEAG